MIIVNLNHIIFMMMTNITKNNNNQNPQIFFSWKSIIIFHCSNGDKQIKLFKKQKKNRSNGGQEQNQIFLFEDNFYN